EDEIAAMTVWDVVRPAYPDSRRDVLQTMLNDDGLGRVEAIFEGKDGQEIAVEGQVTTRFEDGLPVAAQGIFRDITERRQLDKMKQEFISTVSHELRTPLTSIIASLGLLASGRLASQPERYEELISVAHRNSTRLLGLINNLLDLQKLAARKMSFRSDPVDVRGLLDEAVRGIRAFAEQSQVELVLEPIPNGLELLGDRDRLMQVLNNLVSNAIKFSPRGEEVVVGAYSRRNRVVIKVADRGPGIPDEFRSRLFDQFTQADPSKTRSSGGSGLGLSIAKGLVEGMRGHIDLDTRIDEGTTFYVDLPAAERVH
ncbi:MAG: PAS domain-containing sensor histidine kinase, partial [Acidobacteriota bacterium]